jgi:hypothetical protein
MIFRADYMLDVNKGKRRRPMDKDSLLMLEAFIDKYGIVEVLSGISFICSEKAEHVSVNWQDAALGKHWMGLSSKVDNAVAKIEGNGENLN